MGNIRNEKGIALVMVLIFSMIGLAIVSAMLFMLTQETMMSGTNKVYRSADEAGLGGVNVAVDMVQNMGAANPTNLQGNLLIDTAAADACLNDKLTITRMIGTGWADCTGQVVNTPTRMSEIFPLTLRKTPMFNVH